MGIYVEFVTVFGILNTNRPKTVRTVWFQWMIAQKWWSVLTPFPFDRLAHHKMRANRKKPGPYGGHRTDLKTADI
jgi:hypothetical protein